MLARGLEAHMRDGSHSGSGTSGGLGPIITMEQGLIDLRNHLLHLET